MPNLLTNRRIHTPFTPSSVTGLALWLDAADESTVTLDGSNNVSEWRDKSGFNRHATQSTESLRPAYTKNARNGLPELTINSDYLVCTHTYGLGALFVVWRHTPNSSPQYAGIASMRTGVNASPFVNSSLEWNLSGAASHPNVCIIGSDASIEIVFNGEPLSGARFSSFYGAVSFNTGLAARTSPDRWNYVSTRFAVRSGVKSMGIGVENSNLSRTPTDAGIGEIIGYGKQLSDSEFSLVQTHLRQKWGLP